MIQLTRLNHAAFYLNAELIEHIESTPDTVIALCSGQKYRVEEGAAEVVRKVVEYRRQLGRVLDREVEAPAEVEAGANGNGRQAG